MGVNDLLDTVIAEVGAWDGVETHPHRFGGVEFRLGRRELGHLHPGPRPVADLPFPRAVRNELVAEGRALPHRWVPDSGWVTAPFASAEEAAAVVELFRMAYARGVAARARRGAAAA